MCLLVVDQPGGNPPVAINPPTQQISQRKSPRPLIRLAIGGFATRHKRVGAREAAVLLGCRGAKCGKGKITARPGMSSVGKAGRWLQELGS